MKRRKICIVTGSRADWGLFYPLAQEIRDNKEAFILQIIVTGSHMSSVFGFTKREIENDGFRIDRKINMLSVADDERAIARYVGKGITCCADALQSLKPDLIFLLGDRFEIFSAAAAATFLKIPIAHIHGGELTEGSIDNILRHAITKTALLHFTSAEIYRKRVIQMGESPSMVFNVGALGIDNVKHAKLLNKNELEKKLHIKLGRKNIIVTFNPPTLSEKLFSEKQFKNLLKALDSFKDIKIIFSNPNPDMYAETIRKLINDYVRKNKHRCKAYAAMGRFLYLSTLQFMDAVVGNSSSGIIEAPSFGIPTVNIGNRQSGRVKPASVIDTKTDFKSIKDALKKAFSDDFRKFCKNVKNPYGDGSASKKIIGILKKINSFSRVKKFFDVNFSFNE